MAGTYALHGDASVRRVLRQSLELQSGRPFLAPDGSPRRFDTPLSILDTAGHPGASAPARYVDIGDLHEVSPERRPSLLIPFDIDVMLIAGATYFADGLTVARRAKISKVAGAVLSGTRTPDSADEAEVLRGERAFMAYANMSGWSVRDARIPAVNALRSRELVELSLAAWQSPHGSVRREATRHAFACATCGAPVVGGVVPVEVGSVANLWNAGERPAWDESLAPLGHYFLGDGVSRIGGFTVAVGTLYFHPADWLGTDENGRGATETCCGFRPIEANGFNLSCANGHLLGNVWTDCCAPQGLHVPQQNLTLREE